MLPKHLSGCIALLAGAVLTLSIHVRNQSLPTEHPAVPVMTAEVEQKNVPLQVKAIAPWKPIRMFPSRLNYAS